MLVLDAFLIDSVSARFLRLAPLFSTYFVLKRFIISQGFAPYCSGMLIVVARINRIYYI